MTLAFTAWRRLGGWLLLALVAALAGCATALPALDRAAIESNALPGSASTPLGRSVVGRPSLDGTRRKPSGGRQATCGFHLSCRLGRRT